MNRIELKDKLDLLGGDESQYSLSGDLEPDRIILFHSYNEWQVFYLDERGGRNGMKLFKSENDACIYLYQLFLNRKK